MISGAISTCNGDEGVVDPPRERKRARHETNGTPTGASVDATTNEQEQLLPADLWGSVLDFLPFKDVRSARSTCKVLAADVARHIQVLNVFEPSELGVAAARQYPNVTEANVFCLIYKDSGRDCMNINSIYRVLPFLGAFSKLERVFVGGMLRNECHHYDAESEPNAEVGYVCCDQDDMDALLRYFCGAFKAGSLPQDLQLRGIIDAPFKSYPCDPRVAKKGDVCEMCRSICESFPLGVVNKMREHHDDLRLPGYCIRSTVRYKIMSKRQGGAAFFQSNEPLAFLLSEIHHVLPRKYFGPVVDGTRALLDEMADKNIAIPHVLAFGGSVLSSMKLLISKYGCRPERMSREQVTRFLLTGYDGPERYFLAKASYDQLVSMKFDIDLTRFEVVDKDHILCSRKS